MNRFKLTNGTTTVSFLSSGEAGVLIQEWQPVVAEYKQGGITLNSPLTDGTRLLMKRWEWPVESVDFAIYSNKQENIILKMREIDSLLQQATNYWDESHHETSPVWVEAMVKGESESRYALVLDGRVVGRPNPFAQPWGMVTGGASTGIMSLNFTRTHWQDQIPGNVASNIAEESWDYVNAPSNSIDQAASQGYIYVGHHRSRHNNIFGIYTYGAGGTGLSSNVYDTLTDYFVDWTVGDYIEFRGYTMFDAVVLSIGDPAATSSDLGLEFEYYDDTLLWSSFNTAAINDGTENLSKSGVISFTPPGDWDNTAYRIRIRATSLSGSARPGRSPSTFREYSPNMPHVTIPSRTGGDINDALKVATLMRRDGGDYRLMVGGRSTSRGSNFISHITFTDRVGVNYGDDNSTEVAIVDVGGVYGSGSFGSTLVTSGDVLAYLPAEEGVLLTNPGSPAGTLVATVFIDSAFVDDFRGTYRLFNRMITTNDFNYDYWKFYYVIRIGQYSTITKVVTPSYFSSSLSNFVYLDFGIISLYGQKNLAASGDNDVTFELWYTLNPATDAPDIMFADMVLLPVDELYIELTSNLDTWSDATALVADSATDPARPTLAYMETESGGYIGPAVAHSSKEVDVTPGGEMKLYFFETLSDTYASFLEVSQVSVNPVKRYLFLR